MVHYAASTVCGLNLFALNTAFVSLAEPAQVSVFAGIAPFPTQRSFCGTARTASATTKAHTAQAQCKPPLKNLFSPFCTLRLTTGLCCVKHFLPGQQIQDQAFTIAIPLVDLIELVDLTKSACDALVLLCGLLPALKIGSTANGYGILVIIQRSKFCWEQFNRAIRLC